MMDPRFLRFYEAELQHVRGSAAEFAAAFPRIAGRLGLDATECSDPYVERLLEAFAFMSARVQLKLEAEFPKFTEQLLSVAYPTYLSPLPSTAIVQLEPDLNDPSLAAGPVVPRGSVLRTGIPAGQVTACEYRTAHDVPMLPLKVSNVRYIPTAASISAAGIEAPSGTRSAVVITFTIAAGLRCEQLECDSLTLHFAGPESVPRRLHMLVEQHSCAIGVRDSSERGSMQWLSDAPAERVGFREEEAMLPAVPRVFSGYRLLQEYFACPERFAFLRINGLQRPLSRMSGQEFELVVCCENLADGLENTVTTEHIRLFCTPAVNLFAKRSDRVHVQPGTSEFAIVADRTRPLDFETYAVDRVRGYSSGNEVVEHFMPMFARHRATWHDPDRAYFSAQRYPRQPSDKERRSGGRSAYTGSDLFVSLVSTHQGADQRAVRQLEADIWSTNRDLPLLLRPMRDASDFELDHGGPVQGVRCIHGPTAPRPPRIHGDIAWRAIAILSYNYIALSSSNDGDCAALQELLALHADENDSAALRAIEGIQALYCRPAARRIHRDGLATVARGLQLDLSIDEAAFEGAEPHLLGMVLDEFFSRYATVNSFTEFSLTSATGGVIGQWQPRIGNQPVM